MRDPLSCLYGLLRHAEKSTKRGDFREAAIALASAWGFGDRLQKDTPSFVVIMAADDWLTVVVSLAKAQNARRPS